MRCYKSKNSLLSGRTWIFILCTITLFAVVAQASSQQETGYDENTEVTVKGEVIAPLVASYMGLECFTIKCGSHVYRILTAPNWFLTGLKIKIKSKQHIKVVGSKFYGFDGHIYIMAKFIRLLPQGITVVFRDQDCRPVWRYAGCTASSCLVVSKPTH